MVETLLDSYSETNYGANHALLDNPTGNPYSSFTCGQSFTTPDDGKYYFLSSCKFYLKLNSGSTYNITAKLYTHSGTYGTTSVPTGTALATSDAVTTGLTGSFALITFSFTGDNKIPLSPNTHYVIIAKFNSGDATVIFGVDQLPESHSGNFISWNISTWSPWGTGADGIFYVYGEEALTLTISAVSNGATYPAAGTTYYDEATDVIVYAIPNRGYILSGWTLNDVAEASKDTRLTVTVAESGGYVLTPAFTLAHAAASQKLYANVKSHFKRHFNVENFNVTLHALSLSTQDADTGIPAKTYTNSTIEMLIVTKESRELAVNIGKYVAQDALGVTVSYVRAWDKITTATGKRYIISKVTPQLNPACELEFYQAELTEEAIQ